MVQDLATQWIQSYPCKTKTSHETERRVEESFFEPSDEPKVIHTDNSLDIWQILMKIYHGIVELRHLIDPRQMASLKEPFVE